MTADPNQLFARAEQAFQQGRLAAARDDLATVRRMVPDHPAVLHLSALVEKRAGNLAEARRLLEAALRLASHDAQLHNNLGNVLDAQGEDRRALASYRRAVELKPDFAEAGFNIALTLHKLGELEEAAAAFTRLEGPLGGQARYWSARGNLARDLGELAVAAANYDRALGISPEHRRSLHGRASVALGQGAADAVDHYQRVLALDPGDQDALLGLAFSRQVLGHAEPAAVLDDALRANPGWADGQLAWAEMRWEAGDSEGHAARLSEAVAAQPQNRALREALCRVHAGSGNPRAAMESAADHPAGSGDKRHFALLEAVYAGEAGEHDRAEALFADLDPRDPIVAVQAARHWLRRHAFDRVETLLAPVRTHDAGAIAAWALTDIGWRMTGDDRHHWLHGQPGLYGVRDLGIDAETVDRIAGFLRTIHKTGAAPIGQSVRGGTQTRGRLFQRPEPEAKLLRDAIASAVAAYRDALPPADPGHPLLRHRDDRLAFDGSWSIRLTDAGFHVSHIHPNGIVSSAAYLVVPDADATVADPKQGWLEIGRSPGDLGLDLEPLDAIEPKPGRLALFPSTLYHGTRPFAHGERMTVAFDVVSRR